VLLGYRCTVGDATCPTSIPRPRLPPSRSRVLATCPERKPDFGLRQVEIHGIPESWKRCLRCVYPGPRQALEIVLAHRLYLGRVDRMQRNFEPMRKQVEAWQRSELTDVTAKVAIYEASVEGELEAPKHLARTVHDLYFEPKYEEFRPRTIWSLSNAFTSAFKELDPVPQFKATAKLGEFLETRFSQSF
jgi:hypothetical protein